MTDVASTVDMRNILVTAGIGANGGSADWAIYIGREPDLPDNCVTLYDTPGDTPNPKWLLDYPRFQVRVRSRDYVAGWNKAEQIKASLLGLPSQTIGDIRYVGVYVVVDTHFLLADDKGRSIFVNSWRIIREPSVGTHRRPL